MNLVILILIALIGVMVVAFIVMAVRTFLKSPKGGTSDIDSSGTYDPGGWTATDYASSDASDTTPDFGDAFGGGEDFSGGGSGGSWGDSGDSGGDSGGGNGGNGGGGE